jgi:hypothetical protein
LVDFEPFGSPTAELIACRGFTESHMGQCYAATMAKKDEKFNFSKTKQLWESMWGTNKS